MYVQSPEDLLGDGRLRESRRRLEVVDVGAGVGRGDEVDDQADEKDDLCRRSQVSRQHTISGQQTTEIDT